MAIKNFVCISPICRKAPFEQIYIKFFMSSPT